MILLEKEFSWYSIINKVIALFVVGWYLMKTEKKSY